MQYQILPKYNDASSLFLLFLFFFFSCPQLLWLSCRFLRINLPAGGHPTAVVFSDDASSIVVASQTLNGSSLYMYGEEKPKASDETKQPKLPLPEIKWVHQKVHEKKAILTLVGTNASYGTADGSTIVVSCSEGSFIPIILKLSVFGCFLWSVSFQGLISCFGMEEPGRFWEMLTQISWKIQWLPYHQMDVLLLLQLLLQTWRLIISNFFLG